MEKIIHFRTERNASGIEFKRELVRHGMFVFDRYNPYYADDPDSRRNYYYATVIPKLWLPDPIPGVVFVFGSNYGGIHGRGAALTAKKHYAAKTGNYLGLTGSAFAIPTKSYDTINKKVGRPLELRNIETGVRIFKHEVQSHPDTVYLVTNIGTGLAGYKNSDIAPLFEGVGTNAVLPYEWTNYLPVEAESLRLWHHRSSEEKMKRDESYTITGQAYGSRSGVTQEELDESVSTGKF